MLNPPIIMNLFYGLDTPSNGPDGLLFGEGVLIWIKFGQNASPGSASLYYYLLQVSSSMDSLFDMPSGTRSSIFCKFCNFSGGGD